MRGWHKTDRRIRDDALGKTMSKRKFTVGSLFSGAGGMDMGFENAGFKVLWANEKNSDACDTYRSWSNAEVFCAGVEELDPGELSEVDVILGGFPCPGYSAGGPRDLNDIRNILYLHFVQFVKNKKPKLFVAENVKGILSLGGGSAIRQIVKDFSSKGYTLQVELLNSSDYGVPQDRQRVIIVGVRNDLKGEFECPVSLSPMVSLEEAIGHMTDPAPEDICQLAFSSRYMSRQRVRSWDQRSFTIPAMAKQVPLHPSSPRMKRIERDVWEFGDGLTRRFSWREAAVIQTFPESLEFAGDLSSKYRQIGNAVPVKLAEAVAKSVKQCLEGS